VEQIASKDRDALSFVIGAQHADAVDAVGNSLNKGIPS
jgi:hypothetical protein